MIVGKEYEVEFREGFHGRIEPDLGPTKKSKATVSQYPSGKYSLQIKDSVLDSLEENNGGEGEFSGHFSVEEHYIVVQGFSFKNN